MQIIHTNERSEWRSKYYPLLEKHFNNDDFSYSPNQYALWRNSPFQIINFTADNDVITTYAAFLITAKESFEQVVAGKLQEGDIPPYPEGGRETGYLFWSTLIVENKRHTPFLIHSIFKDLVTVMKQWKVNISHVFAIAYTPVSERLMRRYNFQKVGIYNAHYPIMCVNVLDNVYLKAFIPYINVISTPPWPGKVDEPVPEINRKRKTQFDR